MASDDAVERLLERWRGQGWIDEPTYERLRMDAQEQGRSARRSFVARALAATATIVLVAALVTLAAIFWEDIDKSVRAIFLWAATGAVLTWATLRSGIDPLPRETPWLALASVPLAMFSTMLVRDWLGDAGHPGVLIAVTLTFAALGFVGVWLHRRSVIAPVGAAAFTFIMGPFLGGLYNLDIEPVLLVLDPLAAILLVGGGVWIHARGDDATPLLPRARDGLVLVGFLAAVVLVPMSWYEFKDHAEPLGLIALWAVLAAATMAFAIWKERDALLVVSTLLLIVDAWFFGIEEGRAYGTVLSLAFTAVVLFWLARRVGAWRAVREKVEGRGDDDASG